MGGTFVNLKLWIQLSEILRYMSCFIIGEFILPPLFSFLPPRFTFLPSLIFLPLFTFLSPLVSFLQVSLCTVRPLITDAQTGQKKNIQVHSATSYLIFQYLQYWYNQYFPESSSICNTHILAMTSIF